MIVYIITKLELGGAQKVCLTLAKEVADSIPTTLISGPDGVMVQQAKEQVKNLHLLPSMKRNVSLRALWTEVKNFFAIVGILKRLKKTDPQLIVHTHSTKAGIIGRWGAFFAGVTHRIHTVHGYSFHDHQGWLAWAANMVPEYITSFITTHFICVSEHDKKTGSRLLPGFAKKCSVIRAAVDYQAFYKPTFLPAYTAEKPFIIGTISCFKPQKNLFDLLQAFELVHQTMITQGYPAPKLEIIGDGEQRPRIEAWIHEHHLQEHIRLLGWQTDVAPFLQYWDLFALSSLWEGLPCSVVEARLSGVPVIAYNVGGIAEVITDDHNGYLITPGDTKTLAAKILALALEPEKQHALAGTREDLSAFDNKIMVKKHTTLYNSLLSNNK
jgi:glycosyltransferase involved in cell wall biosynthesis